MNTYELIDAAATLIETGGWSQGGPIIEREKIGILPSGNAYFERGGTHYSYGSTVLTAAMRCYVTSKLGDEVDVPDQLCTPTKGALV